jgi:hypothetical protein
MNTLSKTRIPTLHLKKNIGLQENVHSLIRDSEVELTVVLSEEVTAEDRQRIGEKVEET